MAAATLDARRAQQHANYYGDATHMLGGIYGPNELGELLTAVTVDHDPKTNRSRVGFAYTTDADVDQAVKNNHKITASALALLRARGKVAI